MRIKFQVFPLSVEQLPAIWEIPKTTPVSIVEKKRADTEKAYGYKVINKNLYTLKKKKNECLSPK